MKVSSEMIYAYFRDSGASAKCPLCNHQDWGLSASDRNDTEVYSLDHANLRLFQGTLNTGRMMSALPLVCVNCGFVRFQSIAHLHAWLATGTELDKAHVNL